ncbi:PQQ-binding-like beta-propeller repeat protein [Cesiribacter sp. SM1]|uniref:outer membrane protein assembly factor BamB family protein n=1 Tax=Cesiribacter sp. SM1 TaxID=2861196 RepID=UPI001CD3D268|nr:PQQ-binding-like beta-propeller repeat protein [Cesiribacter sp. SM1]
MKLRNLLILYSIISIGMIACDDDEAQETLVTPRANFTYTPAAPVEGDEVAFTAAAVEGSSDITTWNWHFGDADSSLSVEQNPTFIYESPGTYEVTLEVTDAAKNVFKISKPVTVIKAEFPASVVWEYTTENAVANINDGSSAPVIGDDGTIYYVESRAGALSSVVAVTDAGENATLKWASSAVEGDLPNAPSIGPDGNIFINAWVDDRAISKISAADGTILWSGAIGTDVSNNTPAIDSQGNTYHGSRAQGANGGVFSWGPDGEKRWEITGVGAFYAAPVISADESTVYFLNTNEGKIWAVNAADGTQKWAEPVGLDAGIHGSSLSMDADGTIYFTTNTHVAAITDQGETGAVKWTAEVDDASNSGVVVGPDGTLYTGSVGGLLAMNPADGSVLWTYDAEIRESVPAVDMNGNIYVGTADGRMLIINAAGELEKELELGDNVTNSPTIASDGTVYIESKDGDTIKLFKIAVANSGPADSAWPMKGQNVKNTGKAR